jgi:hypothetical protein
MFTSVALLFDAVLSEATEYWELTPEFYFCPDFLLNANQFDLGRLEGKSVGAVRLPPWASSALDFVYLHRKALESPFVSQTLHNWIDLFWGIKQRSAEANHLYHPNLYADIWESQGYDKLEVETFMKMVGQIPRQLFGTSHHPKHDPPSHLGRQIITFPLPEQILPLEGIYFEVSIGKLNSYLINKSEGILQYAINFESPSHLIAFISRKKILDDVMAVKTYDNRIVISQSDRRMLHLFFYQSSIIEATHYPTGKITTSAASGEWFSTTSDDFHTTIWSRYSSEPVWSFRSYRGPITCSAISDTYKIHILGTADGGLVLTSLTSQESLRVIKLGDILPIDIMVTPAWGFILTYGSEVIEGVERHCIVVYTVNGSFVKKRTLRGQLSHHCVFASVRGFDYLAYVMAGNLFVGEVYFLDERKVSDVSFGVDVRWVQYEAAVSRFVVVTERHIHFIGFIPDDFANVT